MYEEELQRLGRGIKQVLDLDNKRKTKLFLVHVSNRIIKLC
jgi:hypothetical protein